MAKKIKSDYDGMIVLSAPINILDDDGRIISIYALLYNTDKHNDDLWQWEVNRYIGYLQSCVKVQEKGGKLVPGQWITDEGDIIPLNHGEKGLIHKLIKREIQSYLMVEYEHRLKFYEDEVEDMWVISPTPIIRSGFKINGKEVRDEN